MALTCKNCGNAPQVCTCSEEERMLQEHEAQQADFEEEMEELGVPIEEWFYDPKPKIPWYKRICTMFNFMVLLFVGGIIVIIVLAIYRR